MNLSRITLSAVAVAFAVGACAPEVKVPPPAKAPPAATIESFTTSATAVQPGEVVTLAWKVKDATRVALTTHSGASVGIASDQFEGQVDVPIPADTIFVLTAWGEGGKDSQPLSVVTENESPTLLFAAVPPQVTAGESASLIWNAPDATEVVISSGGSEVHRSPNVTGTLTVSPAFTTSYTLTAGERTAQVEIAVLPAINVFVASKSSVDPGGSVTLSWKVGGASTVRLESEGRGELITVVSEAEIADGSFEDAIPTSLPLSGVLNYTLIAEQAGTTFSRTLTVYVGADPRILSLTLPEFAKIGGSYHIAWQVALADRLEISVGGEVIYAALTPASLASGSLTLQTPAEPVEVELRASNHVGGVAIEKRLVSPVGDPVFNSFSATPTVIPNGGDPLTLSWDVTNARMVRISEKSGRTVRIVKGFDAEANSVSTYPNADTTYVLTGDNQAGDKFGPYEVKVKVTTPARLDFTPEPVLAGMTSQLTGHSIPNGGDIIGLPTMAMNVAGDEFVDISATGANLIPQYFDYYYSVVGTLPQPFSMMLFGERITRTSVTINVNGAFWMDPSAYQYHYFYPEKLSFPTSSLNPLTVAPWYDDLWYVSGVSKMQFQLDDVGTEQRLIVQWTDMEHDDFPNSRMTFQAQLYSSGHVVFAYKKLDGVPPTSQKPAVGVVNGTETSFVFSSQRPEPGDTIHFFGPAALPLNMTAQLAPRWAHVLMGTEGDYMVVDANPDMYKPGDFYIAEVMYNQDVTAAPSGEWFEVVNSTGRTIPLDGWTISLNGQNHLIPSGTNLELQPNGVLLFAQSGDPTLNGGLPTPDYVYGTTLAALPNTSGNVRLLWNGIEYMRAAWTTTSGGGLSKTVQIDPYTADHRPTNVNPTCAGSGTYGSPVAQTGSPGVAQQRCFPYWMERLGTGEFEEINGSGQKLNSSSQFNAFAIQLTAGTPTFPAIKWGRKSYDLVTITDNGYLALRDSAVETAFSPCTLTSTCYNAPKTSPSSANPNRIIAPYWSNLRVGNLSYSGIYMQRKDPDATVMGDEYTIISWEGSYSEYYPSGGQEQNFQIKFFDSGDIEFHFGNMVGTVYSQGYYTASWLESETGLQAIRNNIYSYGGTYFYDGPGIFPNTGVRYHYVP